MLFGYELCIGHVRVVILFITYIWPFPYHPVTPISIRGAVEYWWGSKDNSQEYRKGHVIFLSYTSNKLFFEANKNMNPTNKFSERYCYTRASLPSLILMGTFCIKAIWIIENFEGFCDSFLSCFIYWESCIVYLLSYTSVKMCLQCKRKKMNPSDTFSAHCIHMYKLALLIAKYMIRRIYTFVWGITTFKT